MDDQHVCDRCGRVLADFTEVGYLGPADRADRCDPFAPFLTLCHPCEEATPHD